MSDQPILMRWTGEAMEPVSSFWASRADRQWVVGETYPMVKHQDRSQATHNHEFAAIADLWASLPERYRDEPWAQSPEHLRKFALIMCRYCDTQTYPCNSRAEAERWAKNLRPLDEYSVVKVEGTTVYRFTAQSQAKRAMGAKLFGESKRAILEYIEDLIGADRGSSEDVRAA
jgi:hypothetical protein